MKDSPGIILPPVTKGSVWRHTNGNLYTVIMLTDEPDAGKEGEYPVTVIYYGPDGRCWPKKLSEWHRSRERVE